jgi:RNA polymerase sigma factor (TIGR02999 family)
MEHRSVFDPPPALYEELRRLAASFLQRERPGHTLQPTALVHEALLKCSRWPGVDTLDKPTFVATAARAMRIVLVDHARRKRAEKRGGGRPGVPLDAAMALYEESVSDLVALDEALERLGALDPQLARIVELRFFGGLTEAEIAADLGVSHRTVTRAWRFARVWLAHELGGGPES